MDNATAKKALRTFSYGLYVVTSAIEGEQSAMTANWVGQVSFEPRQVSISVETDAHSLGVIRRSGVFAVNVLSSEQRELAAHYSKQTAKAGNKLEGHSYTIGEEGCPILSEALAAVECRVVQDLPTGDHVLVIGQVTQAYVLNEGEPLTMRAAGFKYSG